MPLGIIWLWSPDLRVCLRFPAEDVTPPDALLTSVGVLTYPFHVNTTVLHLLLTVTEPVELFASSASGIIVVNGNLTHVTVQSSSVFVLTVVLRMEGIVVVNVTGLGMTDMAGNVGFPSSGVVSFYLDPNPPVPALVSSIPLYCNLARYVSAGNGTVTLALNELSASFDVHGIVISGPANLTVFQRVPDVDTGGTANYSFHVVPTGLSGLITVTVPFHSFTDLAGNLNVQSASFNFYFDAVAPAIVLDSAVLDISNASVVTVDVTLTEHVLGFGGNCINCTNCVVAGVSLTTSVNGTIPGQGVVGYEIIIVPVDQGFVSVCVPMGATLDLYGNPSESSNCVSFTHDTIPPTATFNTTAVLGFPTNKIPLSFVIFSEPVFGFTAHSFQCDNCTISALVQVSVIPAVYQFGIVPTITVGVVSVMLPQGSVTDAAGNGLVQSSTLTIQWDVVAPRCYINSTTPAAANQYTLAPFLLVCSKPVWGPTVHSFVLQNAAIVGDVVPLDVDGNSTGTLSANSGTESQFEFQLTPLTPPGQPFASVVVAVMLSPGGVVDDAGNTNPTGSSLGSFGPAHPFTFRYAYETPPPPPSHSILVLVITAVSMIFGSLMALLAYVYYRRWKRWRAVLPAVQQAGAKFRRELNLGEEYGVDLAALGAGAAAAADEEYQWGESGSGAVVEDYLRDDPASASAGVQQPEGVRFQQWEDAGSAVTGCVVRPGAEGAATSRNRTVLSESPIGAGVPIALLEQQASVVSPSLSAIDGASGVDSVRDGVSGSEGVPVHWHSVQVDTQAVLDGPVHDHDGVGVDADTDIPLDQLGMMESTFSRDGQQGSIVGKRRTLSPIKPRGYPALVTESDMEELCKNPFSNLQAPKPVVHTPTKARGVPKTRTPLPVPIISERYKMGAQPRQWRDLTVQRMLDRERSTSPELSPKGRRRF